MNKTVVKLKVRLNGLSSIRRIIKYKPEASNNKKDKDKPASEIKTFLSQLFLLTLPG